MSKNNKKKVSIVIPVYNEQDNVELLVEKLGGIATQEDSYLWSIQFVDDCSKDATWDRLKELKSDHLEISAIRFSTNFGKEPALVAGLQECTESDAVIFMDGDLQHPPELIPVFLRKWEEGYLNVSGVRKKAEDYSAFKKFASSIFYKLMNIFSDVDIPKGLTDFKLIDKKVVSEFLKFKEKALMFRGLIEWMGFSRAYIDFEAPSRHSGEVSYSFRKLYRLAWNSFTSFSLLPLKAAGILGTIIIFCSSALLLFMVITEALNTQVFTAMGYFVVFNTLLTGIVLSAIGFTAIYIGRIHVQVVDRPLFIVEKGFSEKNKEKEENQRDKQDD
ncbi:glycosyltransferase family 2 protein [Vibrio sp. JC009]|uniref:glycosyltransferase family 2 protein n=1 Tax=Vibrio sp. JC009 TaxID=2912314 RepID=UPI0023AFD837|nr:glycosyltransferase family 2 protein [Vibrio sp. JC009]WED22001.1 glycosyltransferase family 2 protein [Vibrio sp. JC009]